MAIQTRSLSREFGTVRAVDRISFALAPGQVLALVGPNGAGKTTLLKLLLGLIAPTEGEATVLGEPCFPPAAATAARIASVLDTCEPPRAARIRDLLDLKAGATSGFDRQRATALMQQRQLDVKTTWHALSKGQQRWVLGAVALASNADLLVMDEPADGLDPSARRQLYGLIREEVNQWDTTVVITSHILTDVERMADEVAIIKHGHVLLHASIEDLREQIREVELSERLSPDELPKDIELLGQKTVGDTQLAWIRRHGGSTEETLPGELRRRTVSLEEVYLALTEHQDKRAEILGETPCR
ncbi:MAG: ABC transporter ATP-binding protein [Pirellulales bacterium]|nr:ABC transporter ATP-binding protein [Pirellulales bacterium]